MESLLLFRRALASPTMCRFIPALSVTCFLRHSRGAKHGLSLMCLESLDFGKFPDAMVGLGKLPKFPFLGKRLRWGATVRLNNGFRVIRFVVER
jgi:hypothetical protein